jgi:hypothetical protein
MIRPIFISLLQYPVSVMNMLLNSQYYVQYHGVVTTAGGKLSNYIIAPELS